MNYRTFEEIGVVLMNCELLENIKVVEETNEQWRNLGAVEGTAEQLRNIAMVDGTAEQWHFQEQSKSTLTERKFGGISASVLKIRETIPTGHKQGRGGAV